MTSYTTATPTTTATDPAEEVHDALVTIRRSVARLVERSGSEATLLDQVREAVGGQLAAPAEGGGGGGSEARTQSPLNAGALDVLQAIAQFARTSIRRVDLGPHLRLDVGSDLWHWESCVGLRGGAARSGAYVIDAALELERLTARAENLINPTRRLEHAGHACPGCDATRTEHGGWPLSSPLGREVRVECRSCKRAWIGAEAVTRIFGVPAGWDALVPAFA